MASIWRHPNSRYWTACFRDSAGHQRRITTKETDRRKAHRIAEAFERVVRAKRTKAHTQRVIARLHEELGGEPISAMSLSEFAKNWLATKEHEVSVATLAFYRKSISKLLDWLGPKAALSITEITKNDLVSFRNHLTTKVSGRTANHDLRAIKSLYLAAKRDGVLSENPAEFVESVRQRNGAGKRRSFSLQELKAILDAADPEWKSMVMFGLYTGQRLSDIAALTQSNIDLGKGELRLVTQKTGKTLILPLAPPLRCFLESQRSSDSLDAPLHPRAFATLEAHGRSAALSNQFAGLLADAGLRKRSNHKAQKHGRGSSRDSNPVSFHSLRRTATTLMHEAGVPQQVVQAMIGHDSADIHQLYVAIGQEALRKAADSLPEL
jgi:integrase